MLRPIIIRTSEDVRPNVFKLHFQCFMKHLKEFGVFSHSNNPLKKGVSTEDLWKTLIEDGKNELIRFLQHVENKEAGYGSVVVPEKGFSDKDGVHNMVLDWLRDRDINIVNVGHEVACLERSLYPDKNNE